MAESQIDRIRKAEATIKEVSQIAAQIRKELDELPKKDDGERNELLAAAEGFDMQAQELENALRKWREDIH